MSLCLRNVTNDNLSIIEQWLHVIMVCHCQEGQVA